MDSKFKVEDFANPPEKVLKMFEAVMVLIEEKTDIRTMTVQSITGKAGIGKGTAYEYFRSKEEIIVMALLFDYSNKLQILVRKLGNCKNFQEKCYALLAWLYDNQSYNMTFAQLIQMSSGGDDFCKTLEKTVPEEIFSAMNQYILSEGDRMLEEGFDEGYFKETDPIKRRIAFSQMIMGAMISNGPGISQIYYPVDGMDVKAWAFDAMCKSLS